MVRCPVCGMNVDEKTSKVKVVYKGKAYYFCSAACLEAFNKSPQKIRGSMNSSRRF